MDNKIVVFLDLTAGLLICVQFLLPQGLHESIDKRLLELLRPDADSKELLNRKVLSWSIIPTASIIIAIIINGMIQDLAKNILSIGEIVLSTFSMLSGVLVGIGVLIFIIWTRKRIHLFRKLNPISVVMVTSIVLGILSLWAFIVLTKTFSVHITAFLAAFTVGIMLMGVWMEATPLAQKYLTFRGGVLARLGLLIFIVSKVIQLTS